MKIAVINNIKFGYKNNSKELSDMMTRYFNEDIIPKLKKNMDNSDCIIIIGDIFYNISNICSSVYIKAQDVISQLSKICDVIIITDNNTKEMFKYMPDITFVNEYTNGNFTISKPNNKNKTNNKYNLIGFSDINEIDENSYYLPTPYQLTEETNGNGIYVINTDKNLISFVKNTSSPVFGTIKVNSFEELENLDNTYISENKITLIIDKNLYNENKTKLEFILSKLTPIKIEYIDNNENNGDDDSDIITIPQNYDEIIRKEIEKKNNKDLLEKYENIISIYKKKIKK